MSFKVDGRSVQCLFLFIFKTRMFRAIPYDIARIDSLPSVEKKDERIC